MNMKQAAGTSRSPQRAAGISGTVFALLATSALSEHLGTRHGAVPVKPPAPTEPAGTRHGAIPARPGEPRIELGFTAIAQHADIDVVEDEAVASLDLVATLPTRRGEWTLYLEANTTPHRNHVADSLPAANADAGSALDRSGKGRLQVSVLHYRTTLGDAELVVGMLDPAGPLDNSDVANDETAQFLGSSFVNNATIEFPDYTLGAVYFRPSEGGTPGFTAFVSSSHGLADNPGVSYAEMLDIDDEGKGVFAAAELLWPAQLGTVRVGGWTHTGDHAALDGSDDDKHNYGVYGSIDGQFGGTQWNARLGWANPQASAAANFVAVALAHPLDIATVGLGLARTGASSDLGPDGEDFWQAEAYARFHVGAGIHLTPSVQWLRHSDFDGSAADKDATVVGVRFGYTF